MSPIRLRRALPAVTLLAALLVTPTLAQARPSGQDRQAAVASSSFLGNLWSFLTRMWGAEGASIDPWGGHAQPGNGVRPSGGMHSSWAASGMTIDPNGGGTTGSGGSAPSGPSTDPNG